MQINNFWLVILTIILALIQSLINNSGIVYIDCVGVVLIALLINGNYPLRIIVANAIFADLIGHWYLGTHLLAIILVSFLTVPLINFYRMSNLIQKNILACLLYTCSLIIIIIVGILTHNIIFNWTNYLLNIFVVCPLILWVLNKLAFKARSDLIY